MKTYFPVLWLTGNTGAGKTTLATGLEQYINEEMSVDHPLARRCIVLDGDDMRATISTEETLTAEDRRKHNLRVARLAEHLQRRGFFVVVAVIAPFAAVRAEIESVCNPVWVYIRRSAVEDIARPYEIPMQPDFIIDNDRMSILEAQDVLRSFVSGRIVGESRREEILVV